MKTIKLLIKTKKRYLILVLSACISNFGMAQHTEIPDQEFEEFLICAGIDTNGRTNNILDSDAQKIGTLVINNDKIKSLKGIEAFINLANLVVRGDSMKAPLDLKFASKLTMLDIRRAKLNHLDISTNNMLEVLYLSDCSNLTKIITRKNHSLMTIDIVNLPINEIDLSLNQNLIKIRIQDNPQLSHINIANGQNHKLRNRIGTDVDLTKNSNLKSVIVDNALNAATGRMPYSPDEWAVDAISLYKDNELSFVSSNESAPVIFLNNKD